MPTFIGSVMGQQWGQKGPVCFDKETKKREISGINCGRSETTNLEVMGSIPVGRARVLMFMDYLPPPSPSHFGRNLMLEMNRRFTAMVF